MTQELFLSPPRREKGSGCVAVITILFPLSHCLVLFYIDYRGSTRLYASLEHCGIIYQRFARDNARGERRASGFFLPRNSRNRRFRDNRPGSESPLGDSANGRLSFSDLESSSSSRSRDEVSLNPNWRSLSHLSLSLSLFLSLPLSSRLAFRESRGAAGGFNEADFDAARPSHSASFTSPHLRRDRSAAVRGGRRDTSLAPRGRDSRVLHSGFSRVRIYHNFCGCSLSITHFSLSGIPLISTAATRIAGS